MWLQSLVSGGAAGRRHLLSQGQLRHVCAEVANGDDSNESISGTAAAHRLMLRAWRLSRDWAISTRDLRGAATNPDSRYFAGWAQRFEDLCGQRGWTEPASLPALLLPELAGGELTIPAPIVLAGFDPLTPAQARLFSGLAERGLLRGEISAGGVQSHAVRIQCPDPRAERRRAARWCRDRLQQDPDACVGVIVPDLQSRTGEFRRAFLDALDPYWRDRDGALFPVHIDDGTKLSDTGLVHTALLLLQVPDTQLDYLEFGQLLRSPYLAGSTDEAAARAGFDLWVRDRKLQRVDLLTIEAEAGSGRAPDIKQFMGALGRMLALREQTRGRREPAAWVPVFDALLQAAGFGKGRALSQDEERIRRSWERLLEQYARLGVVVGEVGFDAARRLLFEAAREQALGAPSSGNGVQIMTPRDAHGHEFDALWLCGMTSDAWPPAARPNPLIPLHLQRDREIPEADPQAYRRRSVAQLQRLISGSAAVVASWPARRGEEELVRSPLLTELATADGDLQSGDDVDIRLAMFAACREHDVVDDPPPPLGDDEIVRGGSRLLNLQSACPARAFFELRLGAREMRSPPYALDPLGRGQLVHDAAEHLYERLLECGGPASVSAAALDEFIQQAIDRSLERHVPARHPLANTLRANERLRLAPVLHALVECDQSRDGLRILELEGDHEATLGRLPLKLRFDRVDADAAGRRLVIDYKTGGHFSTSAWLGDRPLQLQLPLYAAEGNADGIALVWLQPDGVRIDGIAATDFGLQQGSRKTFRSVSQQEWDAQVADWRRILAMLAAEFSAGDCRIDRAEDGAALGEFAMLTRLYDVRDGTAE